ncbi:MAG TPA: DegT/DnrJ/EryC1/StrS family aminotransferase [bacterium]|nr:DegT/DnrJ/EryC1/StrS family aminotransferase [bacterium]
MAEKLAIHGGKKTVTKPFPGWPQFSEATKKAALEPLENGRVNYWTGVKGMEFEKKWAQYNGAKFCISTSNGTSALHVALAAAGIGPGDEVIVPSYTFIASSFAIVQAGAIPVFADVNKADHCISAKDVESKITRRTKGIVVVHLYGNICEMDPIMKIAAKHNLFVLEDCAQAHGGEYKGKKIGTIGHAGAFSFCQSKAFTTGGEGGAVITNDDSLAWECRSFRDHGYDVRERLRLLELEQKLPYIHNRVGFNYRMTEIQSIIGIHELARFDRWNLKNRQRNGQILIDALKDVPEILYLPVHNEKRKNGFFVFPITLKKERMKCTLKEFLAALSAEGVPNHPVFWPQCYNERAYTEHNGFGKAKFPFESKEYTSPKSVQYDKVECPNAAWHQDRTFITLVHPTLTPYHMNLFAKGIKKVIAAFAK